MPIPRRSILRGAGALPLAAAFSACRSGGSRARDAAAARDERFAHLEDQSVGVEPIREPERALRRARLSAILRQSGADLFLVEPGATLTWLTGVEWGRSERLFALAVQADGTHFWLVPAFEEGRARERIDGTDRPGGEIVTWREDEYAIVRLVIELERRRIERVLVEPSMRWVFADLLSQALGHARVASGREVVIELRAVKDAHELELLARANEATKRAIEAVAETLEPGLVQSEIAARLDAAHLRLGLRSPWCLALVGPASALPHGSDAARPLARGDVVLVDTGAALHGYQSDITRTWVFGAAPELEVERVWTCVRDAQRTAFDAVRAGVQARDVDAAARQYFAAHGYDAGYRDFTHRLGHGIGLEGHEDPYFDGGNTTVLASGMTLSVEPGLYFPGRFGVRIEDIIAVTPAAPTRLGREQPNVRWPA